MTDRAGKWEILGETTSKVGEAVCQGSVLLRLECEGKGSGEREEAGSQRVKMGLHPGRSESRRLAKLDSRHIDGQKREDALPCGARRAPGLPWGLGPGVSYVCRPRESLSPVNSSHGVQSPIDLPENSFLFHLLFPVLDT